MENSFRIYLIMLVLTNMKFVGQAIYPPIAVSDFNHPKPQLNLSGLSYCSQESLLTRVLPTTHIIPGKKKSRATDFWPVALVDDAFY